ncbi:hypothetical protein [Micromonospora parathelypteridis]|uniref:Uncharacterized protein n=1 Tax=Micromonospora parathelypteridis TaxID=1839617 RepID=A0A840VFM9_9ACTN|nr:hypothetical protein [Micromonospora parathelypteridis]MBB5475573.1 hypothetical protein [Micromonospora parathelypteridis]GGO27604.1 hypothetical protein GCM10011576_52450 [Micromonospora parathelypteridis]
MFSARADGGQPLRVPVDIEVWAWGVVVPGRVTCDRCWRALRIDTGTTPGEIAKAVADHREQCAGTP